MSKYIHMVLGSIASGKSSISKKILSNNSNIEFICADLYKTAFFDISVSKDDQSKVGYRCADELLFYRIEELCTEGNDFILEFCPTNRNKFETIKYYAKRYGYKIISYFVGTDNVNINILRNHNRELDGYDYISEQKVKARYEDAFNSILEIMCISRIVYFIDNSCDNFRVIASLNKKTFSVFEPDCEWFNNRVKKKIINQRG